LRSGHVGRPVWSRVRYPQSSIIRSETKTASAKTDETSWFLFITCSQAAREADDLRLIVLDTNVVSEAMKPDPYAVVRLSLDDQARLPSGSARTPNMSFPAWVTRSF
jgi:hypothetical protein